MNFNVNLIVSGKCRRIVYLCLKKPTNLNVSLKNYLYCYKMTGIGGKELDPLCLSHTK